MAITDIEDGQILTGTIWQTVIDTVENTSTGHDHDGTDSNKVHVENLDVTTGSIPEDGVGSQSIQTECINNSHIGSSADIAESKVSFDTSSGHDHDGTDSKLIAVPTVKELYTGTGFDTNVENGSSETDTHELTAISAADLTGFNYLIISATINCAAGGNGGGDNGYNYLKYETKYVGGSYADSMTEITVLKNVLSGTNYPDNIAISKTVQWIHTLTANEKANGVQVRIQGRSTSNGSGSFASITNIQTLLTLM